MSSNDNNKLKDSCLLTASVFVILNVTMFIPEISLFGYDFKRVNLLSDLEVKQKVEAVGVQESETKKPAARKYTEEWPKSVVKIEDYGCSIDSFTESSTHSMGSFYAALEKRKSLGRPVRIAYFGDSFIEGDILTSDLRSMLQTEYGGCGVGYVDIQHPVSHLRMSVRSKSEGWHAYSIRENNECKSEYQGIDGRYFTCRGNAWMQISGATGSKEMHQDTAFVSTIYYRNKAGIIISADINDKHTDLFESNSEGLIASKTVKGRIGKVRWNICTHDSSAIFYGATMEPMNGIVLDNFSTRGIDGSALGRATLNTLTGFSRAREYDMLIFAFGLNVASAKVKDYSYYTKNMQAAIEKYAQAYPYATIMIVGAPERGIRVNGSIETMNGIMEIQEAQKSMARNMKWVFWSMYDAEQMLGGIGKMANEKPRLANKDYTHINFQGGKALAKQMYNSIIQGYKFYKKNKE